MTAGGALAMIGGGTAIGGGAGLALAQSYHDYHGFGGGMGGMGGMYWLWTLLGLLFVVSLVVLVGALVWRLVRRGGSRDGGPGRRSDGGEPTPLEVLEHRYARGEIDREEFRQKRQDLTGG